ncbi:hypothetical protein ES703_115681 [subsurface metagenome]
MPIFEIVHPGRTWRVFFERSEDFRFISPMMSVEFKSGGAWNMNPGNISIVFSLGVSVKVRVTSAVDSRRRSELIILVPRE